MMSSLGTDNRLVKLMMLSCQSIQMGFAELFEIKEPDYEAMYDQMYPVL